METLNHNEYKLLHENAMKNHNGTSAFEVFLYIIPSSFTIFHAVQIITFAKIVNIPLKVLIEFIVICLSLVLYLTVLNGLIKSIVFSLFLITIVPVIRQLRGKIHLSSFVQIPCKYRADFITLARSSINLITAVCILAVDFKCFPRKLAKTENFGYGLMDTGVGLYVFGNGLVSKPSLNEKLTMKKFQKLMLSCTPLFVLGMIRFIVTSEIDYQVHESEYGKHWNFFITLGLVKIIGTLIEGCLRNLNQIKFAAITLMVLHEAGLQLGLSHFIMDNTNPRSNFITANKEGIFSIPGYIGLYLSTLYLSSFLRAKHEPSKSRDMFHKALKLALISLFLWKMVDVCDKMFGCSRRSANLGYIFWILAIGSTMLTLFMLTEIYIYFINFDRPQQIEDNNKSQLNEPNMHIPYVPIILEAINYNGLTFFLLANLLTGLINILFQTMLLPDFVSLVIISYYIFLLNVIMVFLYVNKLKFKIW